MGEYYSRSLLNLAASAGLNNMEGLLHARPGSQFDVEPFPLFEKPVHREWDEFSKIMKRDPNWLPIMQPKPASWLQHVQGSPLSSRAWVLQERLLAPRTLHCTAQGFFWECSGLRASEFEPLGCSLDYSIRDHGTTGPVKPPRTSPASGPQAESRRPDEVPPSHVFSGSRVIGSNLRAFSRSMQHRAEGGRERDIRHRLDWERPDLSLGSDRDGAV